MASAQVSNMTWERMIRAVEKVRERAQRATDALEAAGIPYAVAGGNAVAVWVAGVDEAAVRNTQDVDIVLRRSDLPRAIEALAKAGFVYGKAFGVDFFLDGPDGNPRGGVHVLFAGEYVKEQDLLPVPDVDESIVSPSYRVLSLEAIVRTKLTSFRDKDRTHLRDFIDVGLIDGTWTSKFPPELGNRLQLLLDTPGG